MKHVKKILLYLLCAVLLCGVFGATAGAFDPSLVDPEKDCSLTVVYTGDGTPFEGLEIAVYKVAVWSGESFAPAGDFAEYPVDLSRVTTQGEWRKVAETYYAYLLADGIAPTAKTVTDGEGKASFASLETGLYLIPTQYREHGGRGYRFETFLAALPGGDGDGLPVYDVTAIPKQESHPVEDREITYSVVKQWQDALGVERPASVEVAIYKDGDLRETVTLSGENDWCHTWTAPDDGSLWTVAELNVSEAYTVTVEQSGTTFTVTNTYIPSEDSSESTPSPGDTGILWPYILLLFFGGAALVMVAVRTGRVDV